MTKGIAPIAEQAILIGFDGADHQFDRVGLDVHPGHIALLVIIGQQCIRSEHQVVGKPFVLGQIRRLAKQLRGTAELGRIFDMVGNDDQCTASSRRRKEYRPTLPSRSAASNSSLLMSAG